ncbi:hypothetical protein CBR_g34608 [Chara braunii]|uniref:Uncharacterized protein n=1 Tax=Chara braunii TaxID=69332 RepID=A0A388LJB7_CHABU|nr:hypothetical protein CBR_g34608 [Chara braunii]|eukprot:GBG82325.1 hypothetical protein CBR_g34608 [Chara braunii]
MFSLRVADGERIGTLVGLASMFTTARASRATRGASAVVPPTTHQKSSGYTWLPPPPARSTVDATTIVRQHAQRSEHLRKVSDIRQPASLPGDGDGALPAGEGVEVPIHVSDSLPTPCPESDTVAGCISGALDPLHCLRDIPVAQSAPPVSAGELLDVGILGSRPQTDDFVRKARPRWDKGDFLYESSSSDGDDFFSLSTQIARDDDVEGAHCSPPTHDDRDGDGEGAHRSSHGGGSTAIDIESRTPIDGGDCDDNDDVDAPRPGHGVVLKRLKRRGKERDIIASRVRRRDGGDSSITQQYALGSEQVIVSEDSMRDATNE